MYCCVFHLYCFHCRVFIVSSPLFLPIDVRPPLMLPPSCSTTSPTTVPLPSSFQASRAIRLSHISPICLYYSVALGICCYYVNPIQMHSLSLSPLDYLFRYPMQPVINKLYKY